jgi:zinc protease
MQQKIEHYFGGIPAGEPTRPVTRQEPPQKGERRVVVAEPGDAPYLTLAYRAPAATHPDYFPLTLLNAAFAGGSSLGMFGGAGSNKSSRLYKALVTTELAAGAYGGLTPTIDPHLYTISAVVNNGRSLPEVEAALDTEIDRLATAPITQAELDKALKRAKAEFVMSGESITGQTQLLGMAEAVTGDYRWFETVLDKLQAVTLEDIERVRVEYLQEKNRTVGWYRPN